MNFTARETEEIINSYNSGESMNSIANRLSIHTINIQRLLVKNGIPLRHDARKKGSFIDLDGRRLLEWAKAQGRLVSKRELADYIGKTRLNPKYFEEYPELGQYVKGHERSEFREYYIQLYTWLQDHNISYKTNDKTLLNAKVDVMLLGEYENVIIVITERAKSMCTRLYNERLDRLIDRIEIANIGRDNKIRMISLKKSDFEEGLKKLDTELLGR